jgi:hypothetical protein
MAHDHDHHHHHDGNTYFLEQVCTIAACAALAGVTCFWWWKDAQGGRGLILFIAQRYHPLVLGGGLGLLALVVIRAVAVWRSVDRVAVANGHLHGGEQHQDHEHMHDHDHDHDHACGDGCDHEHGEPAAVGEHGHGHEHSHDLGNDHEHGWAPWRYVVLVLPVVLFLLNLPNEGFASKDISQDVSGPSAEMADKGFARELGFRELEAAALTPQMREETAGKTVKLVGRYAGRDEKRFSLTRYQIKCCAADSVPLNAVIMVDPSTKDKLDSRKLNNKWVEVTGQVQYLTRPSANDPSRPEYIPAVIVFPKPDKPLKELIKIVRPPADPYVN